MRIALSGWFWDRPETGSGQYLRRLVEVLPEIAPEVEFLLCLPPERLSAGEISTVKMVPVAAPRGNVGKLIWEQVLLPRAVSRLRADLLHIPYWAPAALSSCPQVVTIHDIIPALLPAYRGGAAVRFYTALVSATSRGAAQVLTDSEAARGDILRVLGLPPERVRAILLAADPAYHPEPTPADQAVLARYQLTPGYVLYLGGFDRRKNLETGAAVMARVQQGLAEDARFVIAGRLPAQDSSFAPDPRRLLRAAGMHPDTVSFLGMVPEADKPALYRGARVFLYPSRYEGFGLPALEALACGTPVVGSQASSIPEVVGAGGVLTDPDDAAGMAGAVLHLLVDDAFYTELRREGLAQASRFSWKATARATWAVYQAVIGH